MAYFKCIYTSYTRLMAFIEDNLRKLVPVKYKIFLYFNDARQDGVAVVSAGLYTNHLHLISDK